MDVATRTDDVIPLGEAARLLGMSRPGVYGLVQRGELGREMTSVGRYGYDRAEVEALAAERAQLWERGPKGWPRPRRDALARTGAKPGPPGLYGRPMTTVSVRLPAHLDAWLVSRALRDGRPPSAVFRALIEQAAERDREPAST